jgi:hypothetical protein
MAKKRIIDSRTRRSRDFVALDWMTRDLWHGMIAVADDQGRMDGLPASVRSEVWPLDDVSLAEVDHCINQLINHNMIVVYQVENKVVIQIVNWWIYQHKQWAMPSDFAAHPGWVDRIRHHGPGHKVIKENWDQSGGFGPDGIPSNQVENQVGPCDSDSDSDSDREEESQEMPTNLAGWHARLQDEKNKPAILRLMVQTLMPGLVDMPEFSYVGKTSRTVGGAGRLATLIWQASSQNVTGDVMAYCIAMAKSKTKNQEPAGFDGIRQFAEQEQN